jgi:hypothetical protein
MTKNQKMVEKITESLNLINSLSTVIAVFYNNRVKFNKVLFTPCSSYPEMVLAAKNKVRETPEIKAEKTENKKEIIRGRMMGIIVDGKTVAVFVTKDCICQVQLDNINTGIRLLPCHQTKDLETRIAA